MNATPLDTASVHDALAADLTRWFARRVAPDRVDDLLQETFLRIHERLPTLRDPEWLGPWVHRIARSVWIDGARREGRLTALDMELPVEPTDPGRDPDAVVASWLPGLLDQLPEPYREAVKLTELEGLSQAELARRLGLSPSGARSRVQRGRRMLRDALDACCAVSMAQGSVVDVRPTSACGCTDGDPC